MKWQDACLILLGVLLIAYIFGVGIYAGSLMNSGSTLSQAMPIAMLWPVVLLTGGK